MASGERLIISMITSRLCKITAVVRIIVFIWFLAYFKRAFSAKFKEINDLKEFKDHLKANPKVLVDFYAV